MTFRSLALKNVKENWRSYSAFFLSSLFSVAIFYIYYSFIVHPDVVNGSLVAANKVKSGMTYCLYIIAIFSIVFILYSSSSFLKSRKKEFGLFSLFGMTKRQLKKLVFIENMFIGFLSTLFGIAVGILFSKLFLMGLGALLKLNVNIRFAVPVKALVVTIILFMGIFLFITIYTTMRLNQGQIIELIRAHKQPKGELRFSYFKVIVGFISLVVGYILALKMSYMNFLVVALPILFFVILGTFLLYSQLSVVFLQLLRKNKRIFYNRSNMLIISQLGYKIKDNARILFTITILSAVVMTAMGATYFIKQEGDRQILSGSPYSVAWLEVEDQAVAQFSRQQLDELINKHQLKVTDEATLTGLAMEQFIFEEDPSNKEQTPSSYTAMVVPLSKYNEWMKKSLRIKDIGYSEVVALQQFWQFDEVNYKRITGKVGSDSVALDILDQNTNVMINAIYKWNYTTLVVSDERYEELSSNPTAKMITIHAVDFDGYDSTLPLIEDIENEVPKEVQDNMEYTRDEIYVGFLQTTSLIIFIGLFICLLFFIATGSLIYFKLFTERDEDIEMFKGLSRIGITYREMKKVVVTQIAIIFFLPCIVGIVHATFAMIALNNLLNGTSWTYSFVVFGIYVLMQGIYFILASRSYLSSIKKGAVTVTS